MRMILGRIIGKVTTTSFEFIVEIETKKFEYIQVMQKDYGYVLCQIYEIEKENSRTIAKCRVIGYKDKDGTIKTMRNPFEPGTEVLLAEDRFIQEIVQIDKEEKGAYLGTLDGKDIKVFLNLNKLLTKHVTILAKSGAGKSYATGVLVEEILEKKVPIIVIDPHGEYSFMKLQNDEKDDIKNMMRFGIKARGFKKEIQEYGDANMIKDAKPLLLNEMMDSEEIVHLLPAKLNNTQMSLLFSTIKDIPKLNFDLLLQELDKADNNAKWNIINVVQYIKNTGLFSGMYTSYNELVQSGRLSIINLKGVAPDIQELIVYKLLKDLFEERKKEKIPPFFTIIEEAHNFCPERSFGEAKSSKIIRDIASEGRKFGLGLCIISQRPARVDKSVMSQCTTQIILKVTNPNDLKAISSSVEGITAETEEEIQNLPIGTALVTGVVDLPLFVNVRPRKSRHRQAVDMLGMTKDTNFMEELDDFEDKELLPLIKPNITANDLKLMDKDSKIKKVKTMLLPCYLFVCEDKNQRYNVLVEMENGNIVTQVDNFAIGMLPELEILEPFELKVLQKAFSIKEFNFEEFVVKSGLDMKSKEALKKLVDLGYLDYNRGKYTLSNRYLLSNLSAYACNYKIEFESIKYTKKLPKVKNIDEIKEKLNKFTTVFDNRECFLVRYDIEYKA
jgi:DNA helicase HerA-like ATPase